MLALVKVRKPFLLLTAAAGVLLLAACREKTAAEKIEDAVERAAADTKETFKDVGRELQQAGEAAADGTRRAYRETSEKVKEAADK